MSDTLNFGIIGFGKMGRIRQETINNRKDCKVTGIYDIQQELTEANNCEVYSDPLALINDDNVDVVVVCTSNDKLAEYTTAALAAGKHVLCEKPPGRNLAELQNIVSTEKANPNCKLKFGFNHRHHGSAEKIRELIGSGEYGKVLWLRGRYGKSVDENFFSSWRSDKEIAGGGIFLDQGIHMLDLFLMLCGDFDEVHSIVSNLYWQLPIEDNVFAIFRNKEGQAASLHSTMTQWRHLFSLEVFLERGYMTLNGLKTSSNSYGDEILTVAQNRTEPPQATWSEEENFNFPVDTSWQTELNEFVHEIKSDSPVATGSSIDALKLMTLVEKVYQQQ